MPKKYLSQKSKQTTTQTTCLQFFIPFHGFENQPSIVDTFGRAKKIIFENNYFYDFTMMKFMIYNNQKSHHIEFIKKHYDLTMMKSLTF